jgi:hypothetical protein
MGRSYEEMFPEGYQSPRRGIPLRSTLTATAASASASASRSSRPRANRRQESEPAREIVVTPPSVVVTPWYWQDDTGRQVDEFWRLFTGGVDGHINKVIYGRVLLSIYIQNSQRANQWMPFKYDVNIADLVQEQLQVMPGFSLGFFFFDKKRARTAVKNVASSLFLGQIESPRLFQGKDIRVDREIQAWLLEEVPPRNNDRSKYRRAATAWRAILSAYSNTEWQSYLDSIPSRNDFFPCHLTYYDPEDLAPTAIDSSVVSAGNSLDKVVLHRVGNLVNKTGCLTFNLFKFLAMHRALYCMYFLPSSPRKYRYYEAAQNNRTVADEDLPEDPDYHQLPIHTRR